VEKVGSYGGGEVREDHGEELAMTVPTITAISPNVLPSIGGGLVRVTGTGFRLYEAPAVGYVGDHDSCVAVRFGSQYAPRVDVLSATELWAEVPAYAGTPDAMGSLLPLTVTNLDDDGVPIPTETVTKTDAFKYRYVDLTVYHPASTALAALQDIMRRELTPDVYHLTDVDFDDDPTDQLDRIAEPSSGPWLVLVGPDIKASRRGQFVDHLDKGDGGNKTSGYRAPRRVDFHFRLAGGCNGAGATRIAMNLHSLVSVWDRKELAITVNDGGGEPSTCRIYLGKDWTWHGRPDDANKRRFVGDLMLEGVPLDIAGGLVEGKRALVTEIELLTVGE
jgi:hypothetical protein